MRRCSFSKSAATVDKSKSWNQKQWTFFDEGVNVKERLKQKTLSTW
jgi:hypothetical protein